MESFIFIHYLLATSLYPFLPEWYQLSFSRGNRIYNIKEFQISSRLHNDYVSMGLKEPKFGMLFHTLEYISRNEYPKKCNCE